MSRRRYALLSPLGIQPNVHDLVRAALDEAITRVEADQRPVMPAVVGSRICARSSLDWHT